MPARQPASRAFLARLPFAAALALRYARSTRKDAFTTFLSLVAVGAIAVGVAALVLSLAALSGFQAVLRNQVLSRTPQLEVDLPAGADSQTAALTARALPGVVAVTRVARGQGWLLYSGRAVPVAILGFEGDQPPALAGVTGRGPGLYLSVRQAGAWGLAVGDRAEIVSPLPTLTPLGPQPRVRSAALAGTFEGGTGNEPELAAVPLALAESLLGPGRVQLVVDAGGVEPALALAPRLAAVLPSGSRVKTWQDLNRPLFFALRLERVFLFVGVALIVLVAALALLADLALIIANKRGDVAILLAMGAAPAVVRRTFLALGGLLAGFGLALGLGGGTALALASDRWHWISLPGGVFFVDHVPFTVRPADLLLIASLTALLTLAASAYAAARAARIEVVAGLKG